MDKEKELTIKENTISLLERLKRKTSNGTDYWLARDLQPLFGYTEWRNFKDNAIEKAKMSCAGVGGNPTNHFVDTTKMVNVGSNTKRNIDDMAMSRYACYLVAMNGEPSKPEIAAAQTYFAIQTRRQELSDQQDEAEARLALRNRVKNRNRYLNSAAKEAGVTNYAFFHDAGYRGLYGGIGKSEIMDKKEISPKEDLLDCIGRVELAANEFRITQTELTLRKDKIKGQREAEGTHHRVGNEVRNTIKKLGGTMPEDLPAAPSIKQLGETRKTKELPLSST